MDIISLDRRSSVEKHVRYLEDQAYSALLSYGEPVRSGEILDLIENSKYSAKLIKHILTASPRFAQIDRRWDLETRYEDKQRTVERVLNEIISMYGCPMNLKQIAQEISSVFERIPEYYELMLIRILDDESKYFCINNSLYGHINWIFNITSDDEDDLIFDNEIDINEIDTILSKIDGIDLSSGDYVGSMKQIGMKTGSEINNKIAGFIFHKAIGNQFDPIDMFSQMYNSDEFIWLSDQSWASKINTQKYDEMLAKIADSLVDEISEDQMVAPSEVAIDEDVAAPTLSLNVSERDLDEVAQIVESKGVAYLPSILETIFEISPRDQIYQIAAEGLADSMRADKRFVWLGTDRWAMADTIPGYVSSIPDDFIIKTFNFETPEGELIDIELDDEGLEGNLVSDISDPLVLDVYDHDTAISGTDELLCVKAVLSRLHKKTGVYPLCRIPEKFFPTGTHIMQFSFITDDHRFETWINKDTGLIYGIDKWFSAEMHESGSVFEIAKTDKPDEFKISYMPEANSKMEISSGRMEDLLALSIEADKGNLSTFDILCNIMRYHRKGIDFVTLFTELNIVRRTTRRMAASILSSYYAFYQRPKSNLWQFDEKKEDQGFKKAKRKYVRK